MNKDLPNEVLKLEQEESYVSSDLLPTPPRERIKDNFNPFLYLFHGIRFDENLKKLEGIFKERKILSGQYISNYYTYSDNANKGEYVSLLAYDESIGYDVFIKENISLLVYPDCDAILTKYVTYDTWELIKNMNTKHIYSYLQGEYLAKDFISLDDVAAIGIPYKYYEETKGKEYAEHIVESIIQLTSKYSISLPLIDTTNHNKTLYKAEKEKRR